MSDADPTPGGPTDPETPRPNITDRTVTEVVERTRDVIRKTKEMLESSRELLDRVRHRTDGLVDGAEPADDAADGEKPSTPPDANG